MFLVRSHDVKSLVLVFTCRFVINLWKDTADNVLFHVNVRLTQSGIYHALVDTKINSYYQGPRVLQAPDNPVPFVVGQQFQLKITAVGLNLLNVSQDQSWDSLLVECRTRDRKVASSNSSRSDGRIFFSRLTLCADSYSVFVPPSVAAEAR